MFINNVKKLFERYSFFRIHLGVRIDCLRHEGAHGDDDFDFLGESFHGFSIVCFQVRDLVNFGGGAKKTAFRGESEVRAVAGQEEAAHEGDRFLIGTQKQNRLVLRFLFLVGVERRLMRDGVLVDEGIQVKRFFEKMKKYRLFLMIYHKIFIIKRGCEKT